MKQHVTESDIDQLSVPAKRWLLDWYVTHVYTPMSYQPVTFDGRHILFPLPDIGQMIEFLYGNDFLSEIQAPGYSVEPDQWVVETPARHNAGFFDSGDTDELCDALWEAVKTFLEEHDR